MNANELHGDIRYAVGKAGKGIGDITESLSWQKDGIVDQIAGAAEHLYGRARSIAGDVVQAATGIVDDARETLGDLTRRADRVARRGGKAAFRSLNKRPAIWAAVAAVAGYGLAWLIHSRD